MSIPVSARAGRADRNREIKDRYQAGETLVALADDYALSKQRIHAIIRAEGGTLRAPGRPPASPATAPHEGRRAPSLDARPKPLLLVFESARSPACRRLDDYLADVQERTDNAFAITRFDVNKQPALAARWRIVEVPTLLLVEHHRVQLRLTRIPNAATLENALRTCLRASK